MQAKDRFWRLFLAIGLVIALLIPAASALAGNPNPRVLPPNANAYGASYGDWGAKWWQWALAESPAQNPLLDTTGEFCAVGQEGRVWFLAGMWGASGEATRDCTVAAGTPIFFPVANSIWISYVTDPDTSAKFARDFVVADMQNFHDMWAKVDGVNIQDLQNYEAVSPGTEMPTMFPVTLPADNLFGTTTADCPNLTCQSAADGIWLMLTPLKPGKHVIEFFAVRGDSAMHVTYNLMVEPAAKNMITTSSDH